MRGLGHGASMWSMFGLALAGVGPLVFFAWFNKLGDFAKSPQTVEMNLGSTSFVAGGRARLWFAMADLGPQVEVSCKGQSRILTLDDEPSDEVCGIRVRQKEIRTIQRGGHETYRGVFVVTWDDKK